MSKPKITLYFDIVSPFAYMAFYLLHNSPVFSTCEITYVPILLGGLMKACGNTPPLNIKNKSTWISTERSRWASYFRIPISPTTPPGFPLNTLPIQRALVAISLSHPTSLPAAISLFYTNFWVHYSEPTRPDMLLALLSTIVGGEEEAKSVVEQCKGEEVKGLLMRNTERCFGDGGFGLPWFVATNAQGKSEGFWGVDRFGQLCDFLGLERPEGRAWRAML